MAKQYVVYLLASGLNGTLYVGVTSNLIQRVFQHKQDMADGFTKKYGIKHLVWYEVHEDVLEAIRREKQIKKWNRVWKIERIQENNPRWQDLYSTLIP